MLGPLFRRVLLPFPPKSMLKWRCFFVSWPWLWADATLKLKGEGGRGAPQPSKVKYWPWLNVWNITAWIHKQESRGSECMKQYYLDTQTSIMSFRMYANKHLTTWIRKQESRGSECMKHCYYMFLDVSGALFLYVSRSHPGHIQVTSRSHPGHANNSKNAHACRKEFM